MEMKQKMMNVKEEVVDYDGSLDLVYWVEKMRFTANGNSSSKLMKDSHITLEEVATIFKSKKTSGYRCNYKNLDPTVKRRAMELYKIFYPHHEENGVRRFVTMSSLIKCDGE